MTEIDDLDKAITGTAEAGLELLKKSQMTLDFSAPAHHIAYTKINKRGTVSQVKAKGTTKPRVAATKPAAAPPAFTTREVEVSRSNVTVAEFLAAVKASCAKKGMESNIEREFFENPTPPSNDSYYVKDGIKYARYGDGEPQREYDGTDTAAKAETSRFKPYDSQTYILNHDGSVYNETCEFAFDTEKKGHGYYYQINKEVAKPEPTAPAFAGTPTIDKMAALIAANNFDFNEFETREGTCDACGKPGPVRKAHDADNGGDTLCGDVCDECLDKAYLKGTDMDEGMTRIAQVQWPHTAVFFKTRQEIGKEFDDAFENSEYPGMSHLLGSDWGSGTNLDTPGKYYQAALERFRAKYPQDQNELTWVSRQFKTNADIEAALEDYKRDHSTPQA